MLGQVGGDGRTLVEEPEHPVLRGGQVGGGQPDLDLFGQPRRRPADGAVGGQGGRLGGSCFEAHIVRLSK
jgi:hypothetical protein